MKLIDRIVKLSASSDSHECEWLDVEDLQLFVNLYTAARALNIEPLVSSQPEATGKLAAAIAKLEMLI